MKTLIRNWSRMFSSVGFLVALAGLIVMASMQHAQGASSDEEHSETDQDKVVAALKNEFSSHKCSR